MRDAVITVRLRSTTRRRLEQLARSEGRSLSQQVERLIEQGLVGATASRKKQGARSLSGALGMGLAPTLQDFREARAALSGGFLSRAPR